MTALHLDTNDRRELLERFLRYVQVDTQSDEARPRARHARSRRTSAGARGGAPALGCADAAMDEWGYVLATVPGNLPAGHPAAGRCRRSA